MTMNEDVFEVRLARKNELARQYGQPMLDRTRIINGCTLEALCSPYMYQRWAHDRLCPMGEPHVAVIRAHEHIGVGLPADEGRKLAIACLERVPIPTEWPHVAIDATHLPASTLISAFFDAFLQAIHDQRPEVLRSARSVRWQFRFDFQYENAARMITAFRPRCT